MGRDWLEQIQLDWKKIGAVVMESQTPISVEQLCEKYFGLWVIESSPLVTVLFIEVFSHVTSNHFHQLLQTGFFSVLKLSLHHLYY